MFGIGFTELILIAIVAILFLGPDKLPETLVQIAKFFKSVKKTVGEAKSTFEEEMRIADLKQEALEYKQALDKATEELQGFKNAPMEAILDEDDWADIAPKQPASDSVETVSAATPVEPKMETTAIRKKPRTFKTELPEESEPTKEKTANSDRDTEKEKGE